MGPNGSSINAGTSTVFDTMVIACALLGVAEFRDVALAAIQRSKVVTYDSDMIKKFPEYAISVPDYLDSLSAS